MAIGERYEGILKAACDVIARRGFHQASIREIARGRPDARGRGGGAFPLRLPRGHAPQRRPPGRRHPEAGMTADQVLEQCQELVALPIGVASERGKTQHPGGRVVASYPVWAPVEIIHAAGMLPLALLGGGTSVELTHADARFQSFVCSVAKSTLELGF